jgi:hypothetical protein
VAIKLCLRQSLLLLPCSDPLQQQQLRVSQLANHRDLSVVRFSWLAEIVGIARRDVMEVVPSALLVIGEALRPGVSTKRHL